MKPHDDLKWGVHICGPDTIVAAENFSQAAEKANQINVAYYQDSSAFAPVVYANVIEWNSLRFGDHDPSATDWDDLG